MRALSQRQIVTCEKARVQRCRCRCRGLLHGIQVGAYRQLPMFHIPEEQRHVRTEGDSPGTRPEAAPGVASPAEEAARPAGAEVEA